MLEGIGLIEKKSKNRIAWRKARSFSGDGQSRHEKDRQSRVSGNSSRLASPHPPPPPSGLATLHASEQRIPTLSELSHLTEEESRLDAQIQKLQSALQKVTSGEANASFSYITFEDIHTVSEKWNSTLIAIKAPAGTELKIPDTEQCEKAGERKYATLPGRYVQPAP